MRQTLFNILFLICLGSEISAQEINGNWIVTNYTIIDTSKINFDSIGLLYIMTMDLQDVRHISITKKGELTFEPIDPEGVRFGFDLFVNNKKKLITVDSTLTDNNCERYKFRFISKRDLELVNQYGNTIMLKKK